MRAKPYTARCACGAACKTCTPTFCSNGDNVHLSAKSTIHPFADSLNETVGEILVKGSNINPQAFLPSLPKARLNFDATTIPSFTDGVALEGSIDLEKRPSRFCR